MSRFTVIAALLPVIAFARPWQGILPGGSSGIDVVGKFGEPSKRLTARGQEVLVYTGDKAIKGTVQAQFKCDPLTKEVQRIDVYPEPILDVTAIETSYGKACAETGAVEPCYWKKETGQKHTYFLYAKLGLAIFFKDDGKTVQSFTFLPRDAVKLFGLTGGIASGKSTVSKLLRDAGLPVIDADVLAREVVERGQPALVEIAARFPGVIADDGSLDRKKLGERIFNDAKERAALAAITHPRIRQLALERTQALAASGTKVAIYDAPLLIENKLHEGMAGVILVYCSPEVQLVRLQKRDGLKLEQAKARVDAQMPIDDKRPFATWLIDNGGTIEATRASVQKVIAALT